MGRELTSEEVGKFVSVLYLLGERELVAELIGEGPLEQIELYLMGGSLEEKYVDPYYDEMRNLDKKLE